MKKILNIVSGIIVAVFVFRVIYIALIYQFQWNEKLDEALIGSKFAIVYVIGLVVFIFTSPAFKKQKNVAPKDYRTDRYYSK